MFFMELDEGSNSLEDIKRISRHIVEHRELIELLSDSDRKDLSYILKPTLDYDQHEDKVREHWQHLLRDFEVTDRHGNPIRFYREPTSNRLILANPEGYEQAKAFLKQEDTPLKPRSHGF